MERVTINGCFDILHKGHFYLINEAKKIAKKNNSKLTILINSNNSVKEWKKKIGYKDWNNRPINDEKIRKHNLEMIKGVYEVIVFDEITPINILNEIKPVVHIKTEEYGSDCIEKNIIEKNGGKIVVVPHLKGYSTTKILENENCR